MKLNKEKIPDFDDLIFENRNKEYGAYQLRKKYNSFVIIGIIISIVLVTSAVIYPFLNRPSGDRILRGGTGYSTISMEYIAPPPDRIYVPAAPPPPESGLKPQEVVPYVAPVIVDSVLPMDPEPVITDIAISSADLNTVEMTGGEGGYGDDIFNGEGGDMSGEPLFFVEVMPSFRGGDINKFRDWVKKRTNYPQEAIDKKIQGIVYLTFIIETDGTLSNVTVVKGIDPLIDDEAVKAIQASPKWSPGLQRGQPVRVRYSMKLNFVF